MKKQIRNALLVVAALLLVVLFYFLPNIQAALVDKKTFGQSEDLSLNPVEISVEATQTTLEKLKIINNHILSVAVRPSSRTVDGRDVEKTAKLLQKNCSQMIKVYQETGGKIIYRGMKRRVKPEHRKNNSTHLFATVRKDRRPVDVSIDQHEQLEKWFKLRDLNEKLDKNLPLKKKNKNNFKI